LAESSFQDARADSWAELAAKAKPYLDACAWQSAHDSVWPALERAWNTPLSPDGLLCLTCGLNACARLNHDEHLRAGVEWLRAILPGEPSLPAETAALCALAIAHQEIRDGRYDSARARLDRVPDGDALEPATRARLALLRGRLSAVQGRDDDAEREALAAARHARTAASATLAGDAFTLLAILSRRRGGLSEANALYSTAGRHYWNAGDWKGHALVLLNRAWTVGLIGLLPQAERLFDEALEQATALDRRTTALLARLGRGWIALRAGILPEARVRLHAARTEARRMRLPREEALALEYLAHLHLHAGRTARARVALHQAEAISARLAPEGDLALEVLLAKAALSLVEGKDEDAARLANEAITRAREARARWEEAQGERLLATARFHQGQRDEAQAGFRRSHAILLEMGEQIERRLVEAWLQECERGQKGKPLAEGDSQVGDALRVWLSHPVLGPPARTTKTEAIEGDDRTREGNRRASAFLESTMSGNEGLERDTPPVPSASTTGDDVRSALHPIWKEVGLATRSSRMIEVIEWIETYAASAIPILILGETGTGKDLLARGLHALSERSGPLVAVNCAAARKETFVAELFGARRGAYTGAVEHRRGLIEEAAQGTLFLDEVADLEAEAQGFLLRFLDSGEIRRLGDTQSRRVETRIVAATCADLPERVAGGFFRPDLYGRLAGLVVRIPPLRERFEDLEAIVARLWPKDQDAEAGWRFVFTPAALAALREWPWPGNVRELKHAIDRAALYARAHGPAAAERNLIAWAQSLAPNQNRPSDAHGPRELPPAWDGHEPQRMPQTPPMRASQPPSDAIASCPRWRWGQWDPAKLREALARADGRISEAARILGISRSHAYRLYARLEADERRDAS